MAYTASHFETPMYPHPDPIDPIDVAYEKLFLEMPTQWRRYDFETMSHAEQEAVRILVLKGGAELKIRCWLKAIDIGQEIRAVAVVCGDYMRNWHQNSMSLMEEAGKKALFVWDSPEGQKVQYNFHKSGCA